MKTLMKILAVLGGYLVLQFMAGVIGGLCVTAGFYSLEKVFMTILGFEIYGWLIVIPVCIIILIKGIIRGFKKK